MNQTLKKIKSLAETLDRQIKLMLLCGTHSQTISQHNLKSLLPKNLKLITGPGCPVCVTSMKDIDTVIGLAKAGIPIAIYGDVLNVPGNQSSLAEAKAKGAKVFVIYSTEEILKLQKENEDLVFFAIGFETTAPMTAWAIKQGVNVYSTHKAFLPAMDALLKNDKIQIDGFIDPGHVSVITGSEVYEQFKVPQVIAGFEPADVLLAIEDLLKQIKLTGNQQPAAGTERNAGCGLRSAGCVKNEYSRAVSEKGNRKAQALIKEVFKVKDTEWRGFGVIPKSGYEIRSEFAEFDAKIRHSKLIEKIQSSITTKPSTCRCGEVVQGIIEPKDCPLFGKACKPENPQGACMVSVEGACRNDLECENQNEINPKP